MMLERLLNLLRAGGAHRITDLARELDTTPALIEAMLERLERMGYLRRMDGGASEQECGGAEAQGSRKGCVDCALAGACAAASGERVWLLMEKATHDTR
jgi:DNA-binding Lrp family transcriptional regulator